MKATTATPEITICEAATTSAMLSTFVALKWLVVAACFVAMSGHISLRAEENWDELANLSIPLDAPSPELDAAQATLDSIICEIKPRAKAAPRSLLLKDGTYVLYGDLFKTGGCFVLFEVGLAELTDGEWQLRGVWNIDTTWRPKGWKNRDADYLPITPARQPFELVDLSGDGVPEVIIAGEVDKYFQGYYLLCWDSSTHGLAPIAYSMRKPVVAGKYVRLYLNSGARAVFEDWEYLRWDAAGLLRKASWHDEVPYNNIDPHFMVAEAVNDDGGRESFRITDAASISEYESAFTITKGQRQCAKLVVVWHKSAIKNPDLNPIELEQAWLFEKTTGLPRDLYPSRTSKKAMRLEDYATVRVVGGDDAVRRFSIQSQRR